VITRWGTFLYRYFRLRIEDLFMISPQNTSFEGRVLGEMRAPKWGTRDDALTDR
jgi:hypothetical protein